MFQVFCILNVVLTLSIWNLVAAFIIINIGYQSMIVKFSEMSGIPYSPELFLIPLVYYGWTGKITEKMEFNESLTSVW